MLAAAATVVSGASVQADAPSERPEIFGSEGMRLYVEEVLKIDEVVWAMDFIDPDTMIFTERGGRLKLLRLDDFSVTEVRGAPEIQASASGGLFDVTVDPLLCNLAVICSWSDVFQCQVRCIEVVECFVTSDWIPVSKSS